MADATVPEGMNPKLWVWGADDAQPRFLHTMIRVSDFDASVRFYVEGLGMKMLDRFDVPVRRSTGTFLGYGDYAEGGMVELVQLWDSPGPYTHGSGFGHMSVGAPDIDAMVSKLEAIGVEVTTRPTALIAGGPRVAFVKDPDGYAIELIETRTPAGRAAP